MKKRLNNLLNAIGNISLIAPQEGSQVIGASPSVFISNIRKNKSVKQLTFLARNSGTAIEAILDKLVEWSEEEDNDDDKDFDWSISSILIALIDAEVIEADILASAIAEDDIHYHACLIAKMHLLEREMLIENNKVNK